MRTIRGLRKLTLPRLRSLAVATAALGLGLGAGLGWLARDPAPLLVQSLESRTREGAPVFNRIRWLPGLYEDVWVMQQSHHGPGGDPDSTWDRLAIVVDTTKIPKIARFYQLAPGTSTWDPTAPRRPFRASCLMCHSNGPRAVRPDPATPLGFRDRLRVLAWNLRVKTYGRVVADPEEIAARQADPVPLRFAGTFENAHLPTRTCLTCHNEHFWGLGELTRQNFLAIDFMVGQGFMPPPGFALSAGEKAGIARFIRGLPVGPP